MERVDLMEFRFAIPGLPCSGLLGVDLPQAVHEWVYDLSEYCNYWVRMLGSGGRLFLACEYCGRRTLVCASDRREAERVWKDALALDRGYPPRIRAGWQEIEVERTLTGLRIPFLKPKPNVVSQLEIFAEAVGAT